MAPEGCAPVTFAFWGGRSRGISPVLEQSSRRTPDLLYEWCRPLRNCARGICPCSFRAWRPSFAPLRTPTSASLPRKNRVVEQAVKLGLANAKVVVADLTAEEAGIPHPNEMGLVGGFVRWLEAAASRAGQHFRSSSTGADALGAA